MFKFPDIVSPDSSRRASASRIAVHTVCQGSAADVAKAAMIAVEAGLREKGLHYHAAFVLHIHDELVLEVDPDCLEDVAALVQERMETAAPSLSVPLSVKMAVGPSWGELKPYSIVRKE